MRDPRPTPHLDHPRAHKNSTELSKGEGGRIWFVLATANWWLGDQAARRWYSTAAEGAGRNRQEDGDLRRLRAEAAELLGVLVPPPRPAR